MPLMRHSKGHYLFLPGILPYSCGVISTPGFEIVHVTFQEWRPYRNGMEQIAQFLKAQQRPLAALCGVELRSPAPFSFDGFAAFNAEYATILKQWDDVFVEGLNPVARTNIVPAISPPVEPVVYGFSFTRPDSQQSRPTFVVAGAGELPEGKLSRNDILCLGDTSEHGIRTKAEFVVNLMTRRIHGLNADISRLSTVDVYTIHDIHTLIAEPIAEVLPLAGKGAVQWHYSRPPVQEIEFEMDVRGVKTEWIV